MTKFIGLFAGGVSSDLRPEAWKYLFGFYPPLISKMYDMIMNECFFYTVLFCM